jgi:hypothetical protein
MKNLAKQSRKERYQYLPSILPPDEIDAHPFSKPETQVGDEIDAQ